MHTASLLLSLVFSSVGVGYFMYGRRQESILPLACGAALCVYPFFVSRVLWMVLIGVALMVVPFLIDI